ncbi:MAG: tetratricopeptide repeat protein [Acidobacteria bacterium]|nr:tetratricopeptide repeat protein [Acidobacteriota bacterium]
MSKRKIISVVVAVLLTAGTLTPLTARGSQPLIVPTAAIARPADEAQPVKRKQNKLARVLSAPFRALARLFGGGQKSAAQEARKRNTQTAPQTQVVPQTQVATGTQAVTGTQLAAAVKTAPPEPERKSNAAEAPRPFMPAPAREPTPTAQPGVGVSSEGARIVRPSEASHAPTQPRAGMFIPRIEGVPPDSLSQGRALLQHGYLNEAIAELSIAATVGPGLVEANNLLGLAYDRIGWHREAVACYERALSVAPRDPVVLANLGNSLYLSDDYRAAFKRLKQSARLAPGIAVVQNNIGIVEARLGKYDSAFKSFARAGGEYDAHLKLAGILEIEKRERDAVKHYEAALRLQPGTAAVLERLVALYERTGRTRDAEEARRTLGQPPNPQKTTTGGGG